MHWAESGFALIEDDCKTPFTLHVDAKGVITGSVVCKMPNTGDTSLDFTGSLVGKDITGTIDFYDSGTSWSDKWYGDLYSGKLYGAFKGGYKISGSDQAWYYEGAFTLDP
jgi:hypothetical protein